MLLINSIILTVLPTPAPPNRPTLPPLANGQIKSITLMPVSAVQWLERVRRISARADESSAVGPHQSHPLRRWDDPAHPYAPQRRRADRHLDRRAHIFDRQAAPQSFGRTQTDRAHHAIAELLLDFQHQIGAFQNQGVVDFWKRRAFKFDINHRADTLDNVAFCLHLFHSLSLVQTAAAPPTISDNSLVIAACRLLL